MSNTIKYRKFNVEIPNLDGDGIAETIQIDVPMRWDETSQEWFITRDGIKMIEDAEARYVGLLLPSEMYALRDRLNLSQTQIGELLQIGEKTWNRWEKGRSRPSRSINLLLRALNENVLSVEYLRRANERATCWRNIVHFAKTMEPVRRTVPTTNPWSSGRSGHLQHADVSAEMELMAS